MTTRESKGECVAVRRIESGTFDLIPDAPTEQWDDVRDAAIRTERIGPLTGWGSLTTHYQVVDGFGVTWDYFVSE